MLFVFLYGNTITRSDRVHIWARVLNCEVRHTCAWNHVPVWVVMRVTYAYAVTVCSGAQCAVHHNSGPDYGEP